jgi:hypothetical protein
MARGLRRGPPMRARTLVPLLLISAASATARADIYPSAQAARGGKGERVRVTRLSGQDDDSVMRYELCSAGGRCQLLGRKSGYQVASMKSWRWGWKLLYHKKYEALNDCYLFGRTFADAKKGRAAAPYCVPDAKDHAWARTWAGFVDGFRSTLAFVDQMDAKMAESDRKYREQEAAEAAREKARKAEEARRREAARPKVTQAQVDALRALIRKSQERLQVKDREAFDWLVKYELSFTKRLRAVEKAVRSVTEPIKVALWNWAMRVKDEQARKYVKEKWGVELRERSLIGDLSGVAPERWGPFDLRHGILKGVLGGYPANSYSPPPTGTFESVVIDWGIQEDLISIQWSLPRQIEALLDPKNAPGDAAELAKAVERLNLDYREEVRINQTQYQKLVEAATLRFGRFAVESSTNVFEANIARAVARAETEQLYLKGLAQLHQDAVRLRKLRPGG